MTRTYIRWCAAMALIVALLGHGSDGAAQRYVSVAVGSDLCAGKVDTLTFGFGAESDIVIDASRASLSHPGTVFLPDGVPCGSHGCSYRSPVTFSDFAASAAITTVQDIRYVRLNIEHSYFKDLYINITCPNGQKATLMRFGGKNTSDCSNAIPSSATGWLDGNNLSGNQKFGMAYDDENVNDRCNPSASGNEPGVGWNYCWSSNTSEGYTYASGDGIVYRDGHATAGYIDSSNVAAGTNFYHPDGSLGNLVGCPLNGDWYIEVVDGYKQDNGYIFDWELALSPSLLPDSCALTGRDIESPYVVRVNDSTYLLSAPANLTADTVVELTLRMYNSCGDTIDSVVSVTLHATAYGSDSVEAVGAYRVDGWIYTHDTVITRHLTTAFGCDSLVTLHVTIWPNIEEEYDTVVCDPVFPIVWRGHTFTAADRVTLHLTSQHGADSNVTLKLVVGYSADTAVATAICDNEVYWLGLTPVNSEGTYDTVLRTALGCDSAVHLELTVYPTYRTEVWDTVCATEGYWYQGQRLNRAGDYTHAYTTVDGCDSTLLLHLEVKGLGLRAVAHVTPTIVTPDDLKVSFTDASRGSSSRQWTVGERLFLQKEFEYTYPVEEDTVPVQLVAIAHEGCTDTQRVLLQIDRSALAVPNVFTPDAEENNRWRVATRDVEEMTVSIYNRQGLLVKRLEGVDDEWDGSNEAGLPCPTGAYVFQAAYTTRTHPDRWKTMSGTILIIR